MRLSPIKMADVERLGASYLSTYIHIKGVYDVLVDILKNLSALRNPAVRQVLYRQMYFTGIEAVNKISVIGILIGMVITTQVTNLVGKNPVLIGRILVWTIVRELGPLFAAIIIIARSSTAMASELGSMCANRETGMLRTMGISQTNYLLVPRVAGTTACVFILTFYFQAAAVLGGLSVTSLFFDVPLFQQFAAVFEAIGLFEISVSFFKSLIFGLIISSVSCYHGMRVKGSITEIPQVTSYAVIQCLTMIFIADGIITVAFFL